MPRKANNSSRRHSHARASSRTRSSVDQDTDDFELRLVAELLCFPTGMQPDPILDADLFERLEQMDAAAPAKANLPQQLAYSQDPRVRDAVDRILASNSSSSFDEVKRDNSANLDARRTSTARCIKNGTVRARNPLAKHSVRGKSWNGE